jgi:hypothetical protein
MDFPVFSFSAVRHLEDRDCRMAKTEINQEGNHVRA